MKRALLLCIIVFQVTSNAYAGDMYVNDIAEIMLRKAPGIGQEEVGLISSGQRVLVVKTDDEWSRVRLKDGTEGWVLTRFLTASPPNALKLERVGKEKDALEKRLETVLKDKKKLEAEKQAIALKFEQSERRFSDLRKAFDNLKSNCERYLDLRKKYENLIAAHKKLKEDSLRAEIRIYDLVKRFGLWHYLAGAGVLLVGIFIGFAVRGGRRRSTFL